MKAFVTGGTGFVGSHLVEALLAQSHQVACLVRSPGKARLFDPDAVSMVRGDLEDPSALARGVHGCDTVFHVAALTAARRPEDFFRINQQATRRLLDTAGAAGVRRFVLVSSLAAAGPARRGTPLAGGEPARPVTHYGASKLAAEQEVRSGPLDWTIVRPPTVYGPRDTETLRLFKMAGRGVVPVFGNGSQELSLIFAPDLARALLAAATSPAGRLYHASHPDVVTATELARAIHAAVRPDASPGRVLRIPGAAARAALWITGTAARLAGRATLLSPDKANEFLAEAWTCTPERLTSDTGWSAETDLAEGLSRTVAWYREHGWL